MYRVSFIAMMSGRSTIRRTYTGFAAPLSTAGLDDMRSCSHHQNVLANDLLSFGLATRRRSEILSKHDVSVNKLGHGGL